MYLCITISVNYYDEAHSTCKFMLSSSEKSDTFSFNRFNYIHYIMYYNC